jgi:hypothetical protein
MANPFKDSDSGPGIAKEIGETARSYKTAEQALKPAPEAPKPAPVAPRTPAAWEKGPQGAYGTGKGEKRIDTSYPDSPMPKMHKGGTVPKTGVYVMKEGEKVLTPEQTTHLKNAMGLAHSVLSHEPDSEPTEPPKVIRAMNIRKASDGSHVIEHHHVHFSHPMEEHTAKNMDELHDHLEQHWGGPNDGEAASESEKDESPGVAAAEKAVGLEK